MSNYAERMATVKQQAELLEEELGLLTRLAEIDAIRSGQKPVVVSKTVKVKASTPATPSTGDAPAKRRGRPPKNPNAPAPVKTDKTDKPEATGEKKMKLPQLLEQIGREAKRALKYEEIVQLTHDAGYTSSAKDYNNMVYQCLLKLVKTNIFAKSGDGKAAEYVIAAA